MRVSLIRKKIFFSSITAELHTWNFSLNKFTLEKTFFKSTNWQKEFRWLKTNKWSTSSTHNIFSLCERCSDIFDQQQLFTFHIDYLLQWGFYRKLCLVRIRLRENSSNGGAGVSRDLGRWSACNRCYFNFHTDAFNRCWLDHHRPIEWYSFTSDVGYLRWRFDVFKDRRRSSSSPLSPS